MVLIQTAIFNKMYAIFYTPVRDCGIGSLEYGTLNTTFGTTYGSEATIDCNEGYRIDGETSRTIRCSSSGNWSDWSDCSSKCW